MKLVILTQNYENYAWDENGSLGVGENAYWKAKGGTEHVVENISIADAVNIRSWIHKVLPGFNVANDAFREEVIDWQLKEDDYVPEFERQQLDWEGKIEYTEPRYDGQAILKEVA